MMSSSVWLVGWKALYVIFMALAPWYAPLDVPLPRDPDAVRLRAFAGALVVAAMCAAVARGYRPGRARSPAFVLAALALVAALVASVALPRGTYALGASVFVVGPLVWAAILAGAWGLVAPASRRALIVGWAVVLVATAGLAWPRVRSRDAMWQSVLARHPAHEPAWLARIELSRMRRADAAVRELTLQCDRAVPRSVECGPRAAAIHVRESLARGSDAARRHRYNAAREAWLEALQHDRTNRAARLNLATMAHEAGADQEARHHVEVLLRDHPGDREGEALLRAIDARQDPPSAILRVGP